MDGSKERPKVTAGLDLGNNYSYLCLIETRVHLQPHHAQLRKKRNKRIKRK